MTKYYECVECHHPFTLDSDADYGALLDHWADDHADTDTFHDVLDGVRVRTDCAECGTAFETGVSEAGGDLVVRHWCDDCAGDAPNDLACKIRKEMVARPVRGEDVIANQVGCA